jgi:hypothetical protein
MTINWRFRININEEKPPYTTTNGIFIQSRSDLEIFADIIGSTKPREFPNSISIDEPENSARLLELLDMIKKLYGFEPSRWCSVPENLQNRFFGLAKYRQYTSPDLDKAEFLHFVIAGRQIAEHCSGSDELLGGDLQITGRKTKSKAKLGCMITSLHAMTADFRDVLLAKHLLRFLAEPIAGTDLFRLGSSLILPKSHLPLQPYLGTPIDPDDPSPLRDCKLWDDRGYGPVELVYGRDEIAKMGAFDIAFTYERTGNGWHLSFRNLIVSQRFRAVLTELGQKGILYAPVRLV